MPYFKSDDGLDLFYEEYGSGEPVILIHGWTATHQWFAPQIEVLSAKYRVIAVDLRGHGKSDSGASLMARRQSSKFELASVSRYSQKGLLRPRMFS